tara:strand:+ start:45974 stop:46303 length:330 start_codon:yes stop_codon:yes gene_type:complete
MVLLMLNLFAQAKVVADPPGATASKIDDSKTKDDIAAGDSMEETAGKVKKGSEGIIKPCLYRDAKGRCVPMPNTTIASKKDTCIRRGKGGKINCKPTVDQETKPVEQTK